MVIEILVAKRHGEYPLPDEGRHRMLDMRLRSTIDKARRQPIHHPDRSIRRTQQQPAPIRRDRATVKRRYHRAAFDRFKSKYIRDTLCLHRGSPRITKKSFSQNNFL
jgi:hypothetical protein